MGNVQVRLPDDLEDDLDGLAAELHASRSDIARSAMAEGLRAIRLERALARYTAGEFSLERAALYAGTSIYAMARAAAERGIPFFRYTPQEAEADLATARRIVEDAHERSSS